MLEEIEITCCGIRDVSALRTLPKLRCVDLTGNLISDITPLFACKELEKLNASDNLICGNLEIYDMPKLKELNLGANEIKALTIKNAPKLESVRIHKNQLSAPPGISSGTPEVFVSGNPYILREWLTEDEHEQIIRDILQIYFADDKAKEICKMRSTTIRFI